VLCLRIILNTYKRNSCDVSASGIDNIQKHIDTIHEGQSVSMEQEFGWVLLEPGPGHISTNMVKSTVDLCWEIVWRPVVKLYNFKSDNALNAVKKSQISTKVVNY